MAQYKVIRSSFLGHSRRLQGAHSGGIVHGYEELFLGAHYKVTRSSFLGHSTWLQGALSGGAVQGDKELIVGAQYKVTRSSFSVLRMEVRDCLTS